LANVTFLKAEYPLWQNGKNKAILKFIAHVLIIKDLIFLGSYAFCFSKLS
jgi:hypothetical protein